MIVAPTDSTLLLLGLVAEACKPPVADLSSGGLKAFVSFNFILGKPCFARRESKNSSGPFAVAGGGLDCCNLVVTSGRRVGALLNTSGLGLGVFGGTRAGVDWGDEAAFRSTLGKTIFGAGVRNGLLRTFSGVSLALYFCQLIRDNVR